MLRHDVAGIESLTKIWLVLKYKTCRGGEIGRHEGLKILCLLKKRAGSSPALGTN